MKHAITGILVLILKIFSTATVLLYILVARQLLSQTMTHSQNYELDSKGIHNALTQ